MGLVMVLHPFTNQVKAEIHNHVFLVEIAKTPTEQEIGLAKYARLPLNDAMYFPFRQPGYYAFWMKNMKFPIDIIFIRNGKIVTIDSFVPAPVKNQQELPTYKPLVPADAVLEINAGLSKKYGFSRGDNVIIRKENGFIF